MIIFNKGPHCYNDVMAQLTSHKGNVAQLHYTMVTCHYGYITHYNSCYGYTVTWLHGCYGYMVAMVTRLHTSVTTDLSGTVSHSYWECPEGRTARTNALPPPLWGDGNVTEVTRCSVICFVLCLVESSLKVFVCNVKL